MTPRRLCLALILTLPCAMQAAAHEVHHSVEAGNAIVVRMQYADGKPFAFEAFEATPDGAETPAQVGRTDAEGRAVFVPGMAKRWKLKAYSTDGHGVNVNVEVPAVTSTSAASTEAPSRASLLLFGLSLLLSGFGIYQLWLRKKR